MQVEVKFDPSCEETRIIVITDRMTDEINDLVRQLTDRSPQIIVGQCDDSLEILEQTEIIRIYSSSGKVFALSGGKEYTLRQRLYELEEKLDQSRFARISNSKSLTIEVVSSPHFGLIISIFEILSSRITFSSCVVFLHFSKAVFSH